MKPTREAVAEYLDYDPLTGIFRWKQQASYRRKIGEIAGWNNKGARMIRLFNASYPAANVAYLLMTGDWPTDRIDHKNNIGNDNRWTNLRPASQTQNCANKRRRRDNTSGYIGVARYRSRWRAYIQCRHIGCFTTAEEAARAYDAEAVKTFGEFANLNFA